MLMKKILIIASVLIFGFVWWSFAYIENNVFCTISSDSITVTINRQNNYKCTDYIDVLTQAINKEYKNVLAIQSLIQQWYDVDFWTNIRENKRSQIQKMLLIKNQIQKSILDFEENLFEQTKDYIRYTVLPYRDKYRKLLKPMEDLNTSVYLRSNVRNKIYLMQEQLDVINELLNVDDYENLVKYFERYIYLKKKIEWK